MKKFLVVLLVLVMTVSLFSPAMADASFSAKGVTVRSGLSAVSRDSGPLVIKRGQTKEAWVAWNYTEVYDGSEDADGYAVEYYNLSGLGKKASVKLSSGASSWLKASIKSKKLYLTVKGVNKSQATKNAVVTIKDAKGTFAKIQVHRGGATKFTAIKQVGKTIQLNIKYAAAAEKSGYLRLVVFDKKGNVVEMEDNYPTNIKPLSGTKYVYNLTELKKGYTYAFTVGYMTPHVGHANASWAAAIRLKAASGSQKGKVKCCYQHDFDNEFLYNLAK